MDRIDALADSFREEIRAHWHWLHAHPELSGEEKETAAYIATELRKMGLEPRENVGGYGVTALIRGAGPGKCLGLRADFDALPIQECTGLPFASRNPGVMHACGHDAHTAMLLGAARVLLKLRDCFSGSVKLIFQPSEEVAAASGARRMIADGVLEDPKVDAVIGQHVNPFDPTGDIGVRPGPMTAASDGFVITVHGKGSHASEPDQGVDAVLIGAHVITALQSIISRNVSPFDNSVLTIGKVNAGTRRNIVAETCTLEGTCRNLKPEVRDAVAERMEKIVKGVTEGMGAGYSFSFIRGYSPVVNDPALCDLVVRAASGVLGSEHVHIEEFPEMGGEDFSCFSEKVPGLYYHLGCGRPGEPCQGVHNSRFVPDEEALQVGVRLLTASALAYLSPAENADRQTPAPAQQN